MPVVTRVDGKGKREVWLLRLGDSDQELEIEVGVENVVSDALVEAVVVSLIRELAMPASERGDD